MPLAPGLYFYLNCYLWPWLILADFCETTLHFASSLPPLMFREKRPRLQPQVRGNPLLTRWDAESYSDKGPVSWVPLWSSFSLLHCPTARFPLHPLFIRKSSIFGATSTLGTFILSYFCFAHKETQVQLTAWKGDMKSVRLVTEGHRIAAGSWLDISTRIITIGCLIPKLRIRYKTALSLGSW